jgi:hypothetical protein
MPVRSGITNEVRGGAGATETLNDVIGVACSR